VKHKIVYNTQENKVTAQAMLHSGTYFREQKNEYWPLERLQSQKMLKKEMTADLLILKLAVPPSVF
jgi:hypothetical protein